MEERELRVGDAIPDVTLPDDEGHAVRFAAYWREHPTAFVFLRHFG